MHITVVIGEYTRNEFGKNVQYPAKEILVNPDCPIKVLSDFIQKRLNINSYQEFDLSDENGNLVFIYEKEPWTNGTNYLVPKTTYFVVLFNRDDETRVLNPLVHMPEFFKKSNNQWNEIMTKIKKQLNPSTNNKVSRSSKTRLNSSTHLNPKFDATHLPHNNNTYIGNNSHENLKSYNFNIDSPIWTSFASSNIEILELIQVQALKTPD